MIYNKSISLEDRKDLPLRGVGSYRVRDNVIYTDIIEVNAVRQCNLSCKSCSHSSAKFSNKIYDSKQIQKDLSHVSNYIKCEQVRVLGGEPLLHPDLNAVFKAIMASNVSEKICLVTNGLLLHTLNDNLLNYIDTIEISLYPLNEKLRNKIISEANEIESKGIKVTIIDYFAFKDSISKFPTDNEETIRLVYETCKNAHEFRCITVDNGRMYRCPQSMVYSEELGDYSDSIDIYGKLSLNYLLDFLENNSPIGACSKCMGSVGLLVEHEQVSKDKWEESLCSYPEDGIDYEYAHKLLKYMHKGLK